MGRYDGDSGMFTFAEYKNRGVIKLAPDVLVFISGNMGTTVVAPVKGVTQKIDFRDGISSVNVQNNVDPPGSSTATIEIITPLSDDKSNYWITFKGKDGRLYKNPYFQPMMEVKIYFRGRYLVDQAPRYYPAFWGFITGVEESFSGGMYKFSLQCADMLHWWSHIQVLFKPDVPTANFLGLKDPSVTGSRYTTMNAFEIIYSLVTEMSYENFTVPEYLGTITPSDKILPPEKIKNLWKGIMGYWQKRFSTAGNYLRMYGARGQLINDPTVRPPQTNKTDAGQNTPATDANHPDNSSYDVAQLASKVFGPAKFDVDDKFTAGFQAFNIFSKYGMDSAEYLSKLDIATNIKTMIEYEFFQDVNGNFIFKPPFYNLNTKSILPYNIKPIDIINYSFGVNSEEIVTALEVKTGLLLQEAVENAPRNIGYHIDLDLTARFGERFRIITPQYLTESGLTQSIAIGHLSLINVNAYSGSVTIPGRPELRLGYPVYIDHKDKYYYVTAINHSFDFGGSFTTTLSLNAERPRVYDQVDDHWQIQENMIYKWNDYGSLSPQITATQQETQDKQNAFKKQEELLRGANFVKSLKVGDYNIVKMTDPKQQTVQPDSVPYTDEEGYKVIGSFRYGRGIILKPGTVLTGDTLETANIDAGSDKERTAQVQALSLQNMKAASDEESSAMSDYFKISKKDKVETAIPSYIESLPVDTDAQVQAVVYAQVDTLAGPGQVSTPLTSSDLDDRAQVNTYLNSHSGQAIPGYTGSPDTLVGKTDGYKNDISAEIAKQGANQGPYPLSPQLVQAVIMQESGGNPNAESPVGAQGLMQIMPGTAEDLSKSLGRTIDPFVPADAIAGGVAYLHQLLVQFHGDETLAIAAYNAGPTAVKYVMADPGVIATDSNGNKILRGGDGQVPPYAETQTYVQKVTGYQQYLNAQNAQKLYSTPVQVINGKSQMSPELQMQLATSGRLGIL